MLGLCRYTPYFAKSLKAAGQPILYFWKDIKPLGLQQFQRKQFLTSMEMAAPEATPITINERLYRTVREGQADILAPYRADPAGPKKVNPQSGQPMNNNEGDQAVFYNPIQQYNRDLTVLGILVYGESALQIKQAGHEKNLRSAKQKKTKSKAGQDGTTNPNSVPVSKQPSSKRSADEANLEQPNGLDSKNDNSAKKPRNDNNATTENVEVRELSSIAPQKTSNTGQTLSNDSQVPTANGEQVPPASKTPSWKRFTILDALSASGLRAIRYAKEIPFATTIVANDLLPTAVEAIKLNIEHNKVQDRVFANVGDARQFMYSKSGNEDQHRPPGYVHKFDVVDLDPYGTAAPFIDAALQAVVDGGMLCVTCTDAGVWASNGYPEKAYALYGGIPMKGAHSHEAGLRLILHSIAIVAAKYGFAIEPLLCLSIDFYGRLFIRVHKSQQNVKLMAGTTMMVYNCDQGCSAWRTQIVARNQEQTAKNGEKYFKHGFSQAPVAEAHCEHCGTKTHLGGPMWAGPLHNPAFVQKVLDKAQAADKTTYGTTERIKGMLSVALEEEDLSWMPASSTSANDSMAVATNVDTEAIQPESDVSPDSSAIIPRMPPHLLSPSPFFFLPTYLAKVLSLPTPSEDPLRGAFLSLGYSCTRSHCKPGSFKTDAPWKVIWEVMREWARQKEGDRVPRLLGEGQFDGRASVKKSSPGWNILKRLRGRKDDALVAAKLREQLLEKLSHGKQSAGVETVTDLKSLLTSTLYDLEHTKAHADAVGTAVNSQQRLSHASDDDPMLNAPDEAAKTNEIAAASTDSSSTNGQPPRISGKALMDSGADPSELEVVFDDKLGRAFKEGRGGKLVRYQVNPRANWGPMMRATGPG